MSKDDLRRIEATLGIALPEPYRRRMSPFPVPYLRGNAGTDLWDDADQLIARNLELRTEFVRGHSPWPEYWFFIGDPLTACGNAIDLSDPAFPVFWLDHCDLSSANRAFAQPFEEWLGLWTATVRADLEKDGIDPNGHPPPIPDPQPRARYALGLLFVLICLALFGLVRGVLDLLRWFQGSAL